MKTALSHYITVDAHRPLTDAEVDLLLAPVREKLKLLAWEEPLILLFTHRMDAASDPDYYAAVREMKLREDVILHQRLVAPAEK